MNVKIINVVVVTPERIYPGEVGIVGERIAAVAEKVSGQALEVIDGQGHYLLPGGVDVHTHFKLPVKGTVSSDDFQSGTAAAACGGTTTIIDFADQVKAGTLKEALDRRREEAREAAVDYSFHLTVTDPRDDTVDELGKMVEEGVSSFKCYMAYRGTLMIDDGQILKVMAAAGRAGGLVAVHCENGDAIEYLISRFLREGRTSPLYHELSRPTALEAEATHRAIVLSEVAGCPVYIVHMSTGDALSHVTAARARGLPAFAETCPQYLLLSSELYKLPGFEAAKYVMAPPLREGWNQKALWKGVVEGDIQVVSTDHCPFNFRGQKELGRGDFSRIPGGVPGVETRLPLIFHEGFIRGRMSLGRCVEVLSEAPARLFGLYPVKGAIAPGSDADLVIVDPDREMVISAASHHQKVDYSPYEGFRVRGWPRIVMLRGRVIARDGQFLGKPGQGNFIVRARHNRPLERRDA